MKTGTLQTYKKHLPLLIAILLIIIQVAMLFVICSSDSINGDELFSYGLSNSTDSDYIFMGDGWKKKYSDGTGWVPSSAIKSYLVVDPGEQFDYQAVWNNQAKDVHPPFYYVLMHTISSLNVGTIDSMMGRGLNLFLLLVINLLLFFLARRLSGSDWMGVALLLFLTLSHFTVSLAVYTRMYALLCLLCLGITYLNLLVLKTGRMKKAWLPVLALLVMLGCLTHYYFYVFFVISFVLFAAGYLFIQQNKIKSLVPYILSAMLGGILAIAVFPTMYYHVFTGYRGKEIQSGLLHGKLGNFVQYLQAMNTQVFNGRVLLGIVILLAGAMLLFQAFKQIRSRTFLAEKISWIYLLTVCLGYFGAIAILSVGIVWTYMSPALILAEVLSVGILVTALQKTNRENAMFTVILLILLGLGFANIKQAAAQIKAEPSQKPYQQLLASSQGKDCLFVYDNWDNLYSSRVQDMLYFDEIYSLDAATITSTKLSDILEARKSKDSFVIYLSTTKTEALEEICDQLQISVSDLTEYNPSLYGVEK